MHLHFVSANLFTVDCKQKTLTMIITLDCFLDGTSPIYEWDLGALNKEVSKIILITSLVYSCPVLNLGPPLTGRILYYYATAVSDILMIVFDSRVNCHNKDLFRFI